MGMTMSMCTMFSDTTPIGIILGKQIFYLTGYNDSSMNALICECLLGSLSSGILIYMAFDRHLQFIEVDLFHNKAISSKPWLKKASYTALVIGSASMSVLALWS
ncbi:Zinc transporter 6 [Acorus gramineus]|uniref:Zinc transporter 6 n=1 Tax=Acorus gramineus TaxID=55184 RepID=A0AAV9B2E3_ACOGR|nr:Zinc transporter 6 [Acorus gramineus]